MQTVLFFFGTVLLCASGYFMLIIITRKNHYHKKLKLKRSHQKEQKKLLTQKVFWVFEIENKHQHNLKVLESEVEQLQQDIALKHKTDTL